MNSVNRIDVTNALVGMFADISSDIILKTDRNGFIMQTSPGLNELGIHEDDLLILPHIADLADPRFAPGVRDYVNLALRGKPLVDHSEFPLARPTAVLDPSNAKEDEHSPQQWLALRLRPAPDGAGALSGGLAMLRLISRPHRIDGHDIDGGEVDQLTGLGNQSALFANLAERQHQGRHCMMTLVEVDSFRSLSHRYGPSSGEQMICAFADFLSVMLGDNSSLARIGGARFAFVSEQQNPLRAREQVTELLETFADLSADLAGDGPRITASAGLAQIDDNAQVALACAEKALILASTSGGCQAKFAEDLPHYLTRKKCNS